MATLWGDACFTDFSISRIAKNESGYNYYLYIHAKGYSIIMRELLDETEYLYTAGGYSGKDWADRGSLVYNTYDKLVE